MAKRREQRSAGRPSAQKRATWEPSSVRALRRHIAASQRQLADEMGVRQQTVSEWETGQYRPTGASARLLTIIADRAGFEYETGSARKDEPPS